MVQSKVGAGISNLNVRLCSNWDGAVCLTSGGPRQRCQAKDRNLRSNNRTGMSLLAGQLRFAVAVR